MLAGLLIFGLGFFPFSITNLRDANLRVYYISGIGGALFWGAVIDMISRLILVRRRVLISLIGSVFIFLAALNALDQHASFVAASRRNQWALATIVEQAPSLYGETVIILYVESNKKGPIPNDNAFNAALRWLYKTENITGLTCYEHLANCRFSELEVEYESHLPGRKIRRGVHPYSTLILFVYSEESGAKFLKDIPSALLGGQVTISAYKPYRRVAAYTPFPERPQRAFEADLGPNPNRVAPQGWIGDGQTMDDRRVCDIGRKGDCSLHLQGAYTAPAVVRQQVEVRGNAGQDVILHLWYRTETDFAEETAPRAVLTILYADGTTSEHALPLTKIAGGWAAVRIDTQAAQSFEAVLLALEGGREAGGIWFDDIQLMVDAKPVMVHNPSFEQ
jgi:hypothetical protein